MSVRNFLACAAALSVGSVASAQLLSSDVVGSFNGDGFGSGNTLTASDDFNGRFGPSEPDGVYPGGDEVWVIDHAGGALSIIVEFSDSDADLDIFLFDQDVVPNTADVVGLSLGFTTTESISGEYAAGRYYLLVDSFVSSFGGGSEGSAYTITVDGTPVPAPAGAFALLGLGGLATRRRR